MGQRDLEQLLLARDVAVVLSLLHVRAVAPVVGNDRDPVDGIDADRARQLQQVGGIGNGDPLERHRLEQAGHLRLLQPGRQCIGRAPLDIRAVAAVLGEHRKAVEFADRGVALWLGEQLERHLHGQFVRGEVVRNARRVVTALDVRAVLARLGNDQDAIGIETDRERVDLGRIDLVEVFGDEALQSG